MKSALSQILIASVLLSGVQAYAGPDLCDIFVEAYGGSLNEVANWVTTTKDGGFVVTGYFGGGGSTGKSILLAKFDSLGKLLWRRAYGGPEDEEGRCVVETHDGKLVMVGYTESHTAGRADFLLSKFDADGNRLWMQTWGKSGSEKAYAVIEASNNTLWVVGYSTSFNLSGNEEVVVAKIAADGRVLTGAYAGNPALSCGYLGYALTEVFDTAGICAAGGVYIPAFGWDILLAKFSHSPDLRWAKRFRNADHSPSTEKATAIVRTSDRGLALAGPVDYFDGVYGSQGGFLLKTDPDAQLDWGRFVHGSGPHYSRTLTSVIKTDDGDLLAVGADFGRVMYEDRTVVARFDPTGTLHWTRGHELGDQCLWNSIVEDADQCLLAAGSTAGYGLGGTDMLLGRFDSWGMSCRPDVGGPDFSKWSPSERGLSPRSGKFKESTSNWDHPVYPYYMTVTRICPTIHTVCPDGSAKFKRIQDAIDAASYGDIVELCDATFTGDGNRDLDFKGKCIIVRSRSRDPLRCIIDVRESPTKGHRGFYFHTQEGPYSVVEGITIRNGGPYWEVDRGGGIFCDQASPTIINCRIVHCDADNAGGGIYCRDGSPTILECDIRDCFATDGAGIYADSSSPTISACVVTGNDGGGLSFSFSSSAVVTQCTVSGNRPGSLAGGMSFYNSTATVENSIVWGNCKPEIWQWQSPVDFRCCDVRGGVPGEHNIDADPIFCDPEPCQNAPTAAGDYSIRDYSPCAPPQQPKCGLIGALDPGCDGCPGDSNCDGYRDFNDIDYFVAALSGEKRWMYFYGGIHGHPPPCDYLLNNDCNGDGKVKFDDIEPFVDLLGVPCPSK